MLIDAEKQVMTTKHHYLNDHNLKGEVHPKMITSYPVVFGVLSQMVTVRGACDKPFWIYKRLDNCAPVLDSDDVLVVASLACPAHKNDPSSTTKTSSLGSVEGETVVKKGKRITLW